MRGDSASATVADVIWPIGSTRSTVTPAASAFCQAMSLDRALTLHFPGRPLLIPWTSHFIAFLVSQSM
jgi:hypothetical protein